MVVVSYSGKEINAKLVYYGAGLSGKTTNLESIYEAVPDTSRGKMVSMKTQSDRTLFFDLLPLDLGEIMGFKTRFLLYTVPGQVFYNATRKLVLKGADAIVFVADSEVGKMEENKESLANLRANLAEYSLNLDLTPWVIQYNKRDLPNVYTIEELNAELNPGGKVPFFEAVATQGKGVFETFRGISHLLMEKVTRDLRRTPATAPSRPAVGEHAPAKSAAVKSASANREAVKSEARSESAPAMPATLPGSPVRSILREAQAAESELTSDTVDLGVDYGREIELPDLIPPAASPSRAAPIPEAVSTGSSRTAAAASGETRARRAALEEAPARNAAPAPEPTASSSDASPGVYVVPIRLPKGASREIVLRIVISNED